MKKCPFCFEEIQDQAVKCRYCGEFLLRSEQTTLKWYFKPAWLILGVLTVGPFALPLLWFHPRYSKGHKCLWTVVVLLLSWLIWRWTESALTSIKDYYELAFPPS